MEKRKLDRVETMAYLREHVFGGIFELPDDYLSMDITMSEETFAQVLDNVEQHGVAIHGIEVTAGDEFVDVATYERTGFAAEDHRWYRAAFERLKVQYKRQYEQDLDYNATYGVYERSIEY